LFYDSLAGNATNGGSYDVVKLPMLQCVEVCPSAVELKTASCQLSADSYQFVVERPADSLAATRGASSLK
jgi:hypothetical protein